MRPAISSEGVPGCGEESLILIEVYGVGVEFGIPNRAFLLQSPQGTNPISKKHFLGRSMLDDH
jgi:hypothetical protein